MPTEITPAEPQAFVKVGFWKMRNGDLAVVEFLSKYDIRYPAVGAYKNTSGNFTVRCWKENGRAMSDGGTSDWDLIEHLPHVTSFEQPDFTPVQKPTSDGKWHKKHRAIVKANSQLGEQLAEARSENEKLRSDLSTANAKIERLTTKVKHNQGTAQYYVGELCKCYEAIGKPLDVSTVEGVQNVVAELAAARAEVELLKPYYDAVREAHNGYDPECRAAMPELKEPTSPREAIRELTTEAEALGEAFAETHKAERDALSAELAAIKSQPQVGDLCMFWDEGCKITGPFELTEICGQTFPYRVYSTGWTNCRKCTPAEIAAAHEARK